MTLIAAFRCEIDGDPGVIVCADSQESRGDYRVTVDKIKPRDVNNYNLVMGGAGDVGPLIDGLANTLERYIYGWPSGLSEEKARGQIEHKIGRYTRGQIWHYPSGDNKVLDFIICLRDKASKDIYLWRATGTVVEPIEYWDLIGWDEPLYLYEAGRLYEKDRATKISAITLGLHLLSIGKATVSYIDEPFQVIGISKERVWVESEDFVKEHTQKVSGVNGALSKLIISTPDFSISEQVFQESLKDFQEQLLRLRQGARQYDLQIHDAHHAHTADNVTLSVDDSEKP